MTIKETVARIEMIQELIKVGGDPTNELGTLLRDLKKDVAEADLALLKGAEFSADSKPTERH